MEFLIFLAVLVAVIMVSVAVIQLNRQVQRGLAARLTEQPPQLSHPLSVWTIRQIRDLIANQRTLEAIKLVRNETGLGLKDSRIFIEHFQADESIAHSETPEQQIDKQLVQDLRSLLHQGQKIEAVKLARQKLGIGLKEAKDYLEILEEDNPST